jgi:NAD-dependent DNA ligase
MGVMTVVELDSSALKSTVAFTGRLACMTRVEAFEVVRSHGGTPSQEVTRRTNVLVVGELGWPLLDDGRPSNKLSKAEIYGVPVVSRAPLSGMDRKSNPRQPEQDLFGRPDRRAEQALKQHHR